MAGFFRFALRHRQRRPTRASCVFFFSKTKAGGGGPKIWPFIDPFFFPRFDTASGFSTHLSTRSVFCCCFFPQHILVHAPTRPFCNFFFIPLHSRFFSHAFDRFNCTCPKTILRHSCSLNYEIKEEVALSSRHERQFSAFGGQFFQK